MRNLVLVAAACLVLLATPLLATAQEDPGKLLTQLTALDNAKDEQGLVALFAADGVIVSPSPEALDKPATYAGADQIRAWVKMDIGGDANDDRTELGAITVQGDTATAPFQVYPNDPQLKQAGLEPITGVAELTAKDGKVARFTITLDQAWLEKLSLASMSPPGGGPATPPQATTAQVATAQAAPDQLPNTGSAASPLLLPLALLSGLALLGAGSALRRVRRAA
jgi:LPXTG-motif cell wall-anchored protein